MAAIEEPSRAIDGWDGVWRHMPRGGPFDLGSVEVLKKLDQRTYVGKNGLGRVETDGMSLDAFPLIGVSSEDNRFVELRRNREVGKPQGKEIKVRSDQV